MQNILCCYQMYVWLNKRNNFFFFYNFFIFFVIYFILLYFLFYMERRRIVLDDVHCRYHMHICLRKKKGNIFFHVDVDINRYLYGGLMQRIY